jgi:AcrR family transcriptional regulator
MTTAVKETTSHSSRDLILRVALELFTKKGYDGTSIDDIREAAGFKSKASLYTHFKNKEEVGNALLARVLEDIEKVGLEAFQSAPEEPLARFLVMGRRFIEWGLTHPQEYAFCFLRKQQEMLIRGQLSEQPDSSAELMLELIRQMRADYPVRAITDEAIWSMVIGLVSKAVIDQNSFGLISLNQKVEQVIEMCLGIMFELPVQISNIV